MKKLLFILAIGAFAACGDAADKATEEHKDSTVDAIQNSADTAKAAIDSAADKAVDSTKAVADTAKKVN